MITRISALRVILGDARSVGDSLVSVELSDLDARDEGIPLTRSEDQHWAVRVLGVAYCPAAVRKFR